VVWVLLSGFLVVEVGRLAVFLVRGSRRVLAGFALVGVAAFAVACGSDGSGSGSAATGTGSGAAAEQKPLTVAWNSIFASDPGSLATEAGMKCYAEQTGGKYITADANLDLQRELSNFSDLMNRGANVIVYIALDPQAFSAPVEEATSRNVGAVEIFNPKSTAPASFWEDTDAEGKMAVDYLKKQLPDGGRIVTMGFAGQPGAQARVDAFEKHAKAAGYTLVDRYDTKSASLEEGRQKAEAFLTKYPDTDAVFALNDTVANGAGLVAEARGKKLITIGVNASPQAIEAIKNGTLTATLDFDLFDVGMQAAKAGADLVAGKPGAKVAQKPKGILDKTNADTWVPSDKRC
jgi:ribose transport system substrate-binding protein